MGKRNLIWILILSVIALLLTSFFTMKNDLDKKIENATVCFADACIEAEIAKTPAQRARGLMFRKSLDEDKGMLFVFQQEGIYPFTMRNTYIALDIIWIDGDFKIVHIEKASPHTSSYKPGRAAKYVVEVNQGFTEKNNVKIGDVVSINL